MSKDSRLIVSKILCANEQEPLFEKTVKIYSLSLLALTLILTLQLKTGFFNPFTTVILAGVVFYHGIIKFLYLTTRMVYKSSNLLRMQIGTCFILATISLEHVIMRMVHGKRYIWNIDYRQSYVQSLELERSSADTLNNFTYSGFQSSYHSGHALLAAQIKKVTNLDLDFGLFFFVPLIAFISIVTFITAVGKFFTFNNSSILTVNIACLFLPTFLFMSAASKPKFIQGNLLGSHLMLNGLLALATIFGIGSIAILRSTRLGPVLVWMSITQFSLIAIKPQYIPFSALFFGLLLVIRSVAVAKIVFFLLFNFPIFFLISRTSAAPSFSLGFAVPNLDILLLPFIFGLALFLVRLAQSEAAKSVFRERIFFSFIIALFLFTGVRLIMDVLEFRIDIGTLLRIREFWPWADNSIFDRDLEQGLLILYIWVMVLFAFSLLRILRLSGRRYRILVVIMTFLVCLSAWSTFQRVSYPIQFNEAVDTLDLDETLENIPLDARVLVNDISDPADGFQRAGRGEFLAMGGRVRFYLASSMPDNYLAPDYLQRVHAVRNFFRNPISDQSFEFLETNGIDFILVSTRCIPVWLEDINWQSDIPRFVLYSRDDLVDRKRNSNIGELRTPVPQIKRHGVTDCI